MLRRTVPVVFLALAAVVTSQGAFAKRVLAQHSQKAPWRIYRISTRFTRTLHIHTIGLRDTGSGTGGGNVSCAVSVTTKGSVSSYYIGTSTAPGYKYVLGATSVAGVPVAPVPMRFDVPGKLSIVVGHTSCADGSKPLVDCAGTYNLPLHVGEFLQAGPLAVSRTKAITAWYFSYHVLPSARAGFKAEVPASCHGDDPSFSTLPVDAFDLLATGTWAGPYHGGIPVDVQRARLLIGKSFATKLSLPWNVDYDRGQGTMQTWATLTRVR